jgi:solute carrier family 25, member 39/40
MTTTTSQEPPTSTYTHFPSFLPSLLPSHQIGRTEGLPGLYRGLAPSLAMAIPSTVLYYSLYDSLREAFHNLGAGPIVAPLIGGSCSRVVAATATAPLELVRTRMQVM